MQAPVTTVYLFRHGATAWNAEGRWAGRAEMPMSDLGREQMTRLGARLAAEGTFAAVYASPLGRARESAAIVAARVNAAVLVDERLLELSYGTWEGKTPAEVTATAEGAELYAAWTRSPATVRTPEGESAAEVLARARAWLADVAARHAGARVAACGHRTTNRIVVAHALGFALDEYRRAVPQHNGALNVLAVEPDGTFRALSVNDTSHLAGLPAAEGS
jgi:probable phosphoglycerate mutase